MKYLPKLKQNTLNYDIIKKIIQESNLQTNIEPSFYSFQKKNYKPHLFIKFLGNDQNSYGIVLTHSDVIKLDEISNDYWFTKELPLNNSIIKEISTSKIYKKTTGSKIALSVISNKSLKPVKNIYTNDKKLLFVKKIAYETGLTRYDELKKISNNILTFHKLENTISFAENKNISFLFQNKTHAKLIKNINELKPLIGESAYIELIQIPQECSKDEVTINYIDELKSIVSLIEQKGIGTLELLASLQSLYY